MNYKKKEKVTQKMFYYCFILQTTELIQPTTCYS